MPELPEVETIRGDLDKTLRGKKILGMETDSPKQFQPSFETVEKNIVGATIKEIKRRAKLILFYLSHGKILVIHLKLTGRLLIRKQGESQDEWQHAVFRLSDGLELRFADLRKFGYLKLAETEKELEHLLGEFGPEPFVGQTSSGQAFLILEKFREILNSSGKPIKILLLDQKKIAGVGNIYANEALFLAGVDPGRKAKDLLPEEKEKLYQSLNQVLEEGIKYRGASDQIYLDAFGKEGKYQEHFRVYSRVGKPCLGNCGGMVKRISLGGRGTFFCPNCQK